ncbi:MAG: ABC transporter permease [Phycisphaerales bacterium]
MRPRELLARANRVQQTPRFKVAASIGVVVLAVAVFAVYFVSATSGDAPAVQTPAASAGPVAEDEAPPMSEAHRSALEAISRLSADVLARRQDPFGFGVGAAVLTGLALVVIWLGAGLTALAVVLVLTLVIGPMWWLGGTEFASGIYLDEEHRSTLGSWLRDAARLLGGLVGLGGAFMVLMRGLHALYGPTGPVFAVARNVLAEAVRMKVSVVFIVLLVFALAALPDQLNTTTPLRYRVQSFLQFGTGGSFWIIAILVLFFGVGTVAFEQRDRQIWQTMTKPVAAWQYVLGKWLGVAGLAAVLLIVSTSAIFLFTEYLRQQPAHGEDRATGATAPTSDRLILETQVLTARTSVGPELPLGATDEQLLEGVRSFIEVRRTTDPTFAMDDATYRQVVGDLRKNIIQAHRTIEPGAYDVFYFKGLPPPRPVGARGDAPPSGFSRLLGIVTGLFQRPPVREFTLRYKIESGANLPNTTYKLSFAFNGFEPSVEDVGMASTHTLQLQPGVVNNDGTAELSILNGDDRTGTTNPSAVTFPPGGLELSYTVGSFHGNFLRAALVLWVKLAFLAMVGIAAGTFLSFPVACLVAFSVFLAAEGASFLSESLQYYDAIDEKKNILPHKVVIRAIGLAVAWMFRVYAELKPTAKLIDGRSITWLSVASGTGVLGAWSLFLYGMAVVIFRRRELATYSGQ